MVNIVLNQYKSNIARGSKKFQIGPERKVGCLHISTIVNTKVAEFVKQQPHRGSSRYYLSKVLKQRKKKVRVTSNSFSQCSLLISTFKCIRD